MFIDANKLVELIDAAKECEEKLSEEEQWIHVKDIAATLQSLIDEETARLDKMADDFEEAEYGQHERENATIVKEMAWLYDWPGGI
jgi:rubrerythrin